jgi:hypothetical protein
MSIKSTRYLSRGEALDLYHQLMSKLYGLHAAMTNEQLGDALDELREEECRREGRACFDNYLVTDSRPKED